LLFQTWIAIHNHFVKIKPVFRNLKISLKIPAHKRSRFENWMLSHVVQKNWAWKFTNPFDYSAVTITASPTRFSPAERSVQYKNIFNRFCRRTAIHEQKVADT